MLLIIIEFLVKEMRLLHEKWIPFYEVEPLDDVGKDVRVAVLLNVHEELWADHEGPAIAAGDADHLDSARPSVKVWNLPILL